MHHPRTPVLRLLTILVGAGGMMGQILLLREFLVVAHGNELTMGIVLANWLLLESAGAFFSGRTLAAGNRPVASYSHLLACYGVLLPLSLFLSRGGARFFAAVVPGEALSTAQLFVLSLALIGPVSAVHGALFPLASRVLREISDDGTAIGRIYLHETLGTLLGGALLTLFLVDRFHSLQISLVIFVLHLIAAAAASRYLQPGPEWGRRTKGAFIGLSILLFLLVPPISSSLHHLSLSWQWRQQQIMHYENSPFGNIVTVETLGEYTFFYDGQPVMTVPSPDEASIGDFVHIVCGSHRRPERVLLIGTGLGGVLNQLLRHPVADVQYTELDPNLPAVIGRFPTEMTESELADPRVTIRHTDGRLFLAQTEERFDLVILGFIEPGTLQANRLFTREFFSVVSDSLTEDGLLAFSAVGAPAYMTPDTADLNSSLYRTVGEVFDNVLIIPGEANYFLASPKPINTDAAVISSRLRERGIIGGFLTAEYLAYRLDPERRQRAEQLMAASDARLNFDFNPAALSYALSHWGSTFSPGLAGILSSLRARSPPDYFILPIALTLILMAVVRRLPVRQHLGLSYALCTSGMAGMAFDLLVLFIFQCLYGYVYQMAGLLVAAFMGGIYAGGTWGMRQARGTARQEVFKYLEVAIAALLLGLYGFTLLLQQLVGQFPNLLILAAIALYTALSGFTVGAQFPLAAAMASDGRDQQGTERVAGTLYAADLMGGWFAGLAVSVLLFPAIGLLYTLLLLCALKVSSLIVLTTSGT